MRRLSFYKQNILRNIKDKDSKILVLGADTLDKNIFIDLGYKNVTLSNYEKENDNDDIYKNILMQNINLNDNSFEYCVAHACVHHSSKPHNAILEMYRVASKGVLVIEANDCLLTRIACKLNFAEEFENTAILKNKTSGGVDNSSIANYVFRWTEREVLKLLKSYKPNIKHNITFKYDYDLKFTKNILINFLFKLFFLLFKKQQNLMSFFINKNS